MNSRRLVFIGILALALGAVVSTLVYHQLQAKTAPAKATVDVVVAAKDIQVGAKIAEQDLKIVKYLPDDLPSDFFRAKSSVVGHGAVLPIDTGEQVIVTTELSEIEAQVTHTPNGAKQTTYHLIIDFEIMKHIVQFRKFHQSQSISSDFYRKSKLGILKITKIKTGYVLWRKISSLS